MSAAVARVRPAMPTPEAAWSAHEARWSDRGPSGAVSWGDMATGRLLRERLAEAQNRRRCHRGRAVDEASGERAARPAFEHVEPLSEGGADDPGNLGVACAGCGSDRRDGRRHSRYSGAGALAA